MKFKVGQPVELSARGLRYLKKRSPRGWVIGVSIIGVKVKFDGTEGEAEWWDPSWFIPRDGEWIN